MRTYNAAVIGLGNIGMLYDYYLDHQTQILTHCAAYEVHEGFNLIGSVDSDKEKRSLFEKKYNKPAYPSIDELLKYSEPEVISLCIPFYMQHALFFEIVRKTLPKAILCEKPFANTLVEAQEMVNFSEKHNILSVVNYIRRFEPGVQKVLNLLKESAIGNIKKIITWYSKGMSSNGCHVIDLIHYFLKEVYPTCELDSLQTFQSGQEIRFTYNDIPVYLFMTPPEYIRFEIQLIGESGVISYLNSGREILLHKLKRDRDYSILDKVSDIIPNDLGRYQWYTQDALYQGLSNGSAINSTGRTALFTEKFMSKLSANLIGA